MAAPALLLTMFYKSILKTVQSWRFLKAKHAWIYWKRPLFQVPPCLYSRTYSNSNFFIVYCGVYFIGLTHVSVMFCSGSIISITPLDILTLLMYDNFPIQKMNNLRTSQSQKNDEYLMSVCKYLPVKTRIIQKPKPVIWLALQISWPVSIWHGFLLNGISKWNVKILRRKPNLFICIKKNINDEDGR